MPVKTYIPLKDRANYRPKKGFFNDIFVRQGPFIGVDGKLLVPEKKWGVLMYERQKGCDPGTGKCTVRGLFVSEIQADLCAQGLVEKEVERREQILADAS